MSDIIPAPSDVAERAHVDRIADEFFGGFDLVADIAHPAVSIFGSARIPETHPAYEEAIELGRRFAEAGFAVITGGGPGLMEAANRGARSAGGTSIGLNIELPREQRPNPYLDLSLTFRHFWGGLLEWLRERALAEGMIAPVDLALVTLTDDPDECVRSLVEASGHRRGGHTHPR